ncbi:MAG: endolytic transglycosylase MltG [Actinomycetota bacterium]
MERAQRRSDRYGHPDDRSRRGVFLALLLAFLVVLGGVIGVGAYYNYCKGAGGAQRAVSLTVRPGTSGESVLSMLHDRGVVRCGGIVGRILLRGTGEADRIRTGTYALTTNMTIADAIHVLATPPKPAPTVRLTIPEGYRLTQIAGRVQQELGIPAGAFLRSAQATSWSLAPYLPAGHGTEGFLFPQTYDFLQHGTTADDVIKRLLAEFTTATQSLPWAGAKALGLTDYQVVIVASMIEREARVPGDRPKIAAVIYNRLSRRMPLGIDATVAYIDPDPSNGLTASDFRIDSPYNTRLHTGLPPTPIASPGIPSLRAALQPANVPYLYYVLCGADGHHKFSSTYAQFLRDKAACLG